MTQSTELTAPAVDSIKQISRAFVAAKRSFSRVIKKSSNPHFKSSYADLSECVDAVNDALLQQGIALIQKTHKATDGIIVETTFLHESGETLSGGQLFIPVNKPDPQAYCTALSYGRRHSLLAACGIASEDDDGNGGAHKNSAAKAITDTQAAELRALVKEAGIDQEMFLGHYKAESFIELPLAVYPRAKRTVENRIRSNQAQKEETAV